MTEAVRFWHRIGAPTWTGLRARLSECSPAALLYGAQILVLYGICDYATTIVGFHLGAHERNPVVRWVLVEWGPAGFAMTKLLAVLILLRLLVTYFRLLAFTRDQGAIGPRAYLLYRHGAPLALLSATGWVLYTNVTAILYHL